MFMKVFRKDCTVLIYFVYCSNSRLKKTEVTQQPALKQDPLVTIDNCCDKILPLSSILHVCSYIYQNPVWS
jgi:hypothetical protein